MRILVLAPQPFMTQRGTPIAVKMLLETLAARGDELDVVVYPDGEDITIDRCRFFRVPSLPGTRNVPPGFSLKKLILDAVMLPMVAWRMIRTRYDLVIAVEESAYIAMVLRPFFRVPYIADVDSSIPEQISDKYTLPRWMQGFLVGAERMATRNAVGAITCCRALEDLVRGYDPDLPVRTVEDITMLPPEEARQRVPEGWSYDVPVVIYVGNLESYQGVDLLVEGFARLDPAETPAHLAVIGGSAEHIAAFEAQVERLGASDRISFLGPRPVDALGIYLNAATITASPRTQGRNTPMKIYSYLDSGRPLIATRLSTHTQVLDDEIAMLVEPDAAHLARGLRALLSDPDLRGRMAAAARTRVQEEFSPAAYERKLVGFIETEIEPRLTRAKPVET